MYSSDWEAIEQDKEAKKQLVLLTLKERCTPASVVPEFRKFSDEPLDITILTGGLVNYSYKISLKSDPKICVFAKLSFDYPVCCSKNDHYDVVRTEHEYQILEKFHKIHPDCVTEPYFCIDAGPEMKLMVTEWAPADEQFANQFVDGIVDQRPAAQLAQALAQLHLMEFDPDFNVNVINVVDNFFSNVKVDLVDNLLDAQDDTPATAIASELGRDHMYWLVDQLVASMTKKECLSHNDPHVFNLLVEAKPDVSKLDAFGPDGALYLIDWEICHPAPMGRDLGVFWAFPFATMLFHALHGNHDAVENIWGALVTMWDTYRKIMMKKGNKTHEGMTTVYRTAIGWTGMILALYVTSNFHIDELPIRSDEDRELFKGHLAKLGLLFLHWSLADDTGIDPNNLPSLVEEAIRAEISQLTMTRAAAKHVGPNRSSMLRMSGRRISDAGLYFGNDETRASFPRDGNLEDLLKEDKKTNE